LWDQPCKLCLYNRAYGSGLPPLRIGMGPRLKIRCRGFYWQHGFSCSCVISRDTQGTGREEALDAEKLGCSGCVPTRVALRANRQHTWKSRKGNIGIRVSASPFSSPPWLQDALVWAMRNQLWGHALFLSSKMDPRTYSWVLTG